ncbi:MAG: Fic family protein [Oscillospiraceae bacterium]|nr:Fic family protein [Oscillospiraceae bacterium]
MNKVIDDSYLYEDSTTLRNLLHIRDQKALEVAEAEISSANMMLLYEKGFSSFSSSGIKMIHKALFRDIYDWAGAFRIINVMKRESLLAGKSVWYANVADIESDLDKGWATINKVNWADLDAINFAKTLSRTFPALWQAHPFRDGNTRTVVMLMTFFVEHYGFFFDQELFAASAGYVRNAFVMACWGEHSEYEHLERILIDTISDSQTYQNENADSLFTVERTRAEVYEKYATEDYQPIPHEYRMEE